MSDRSPINPDPTTQVNAITAAAGLPVDPQEQELMVKLYPTMQTMAQGLRIPEIQYAEPALIYTATTGSDPDPTPVLSQIQQVEALYFNHEYESDPQVLNGVLPYVTGYMKARQVLQGMDLGQTKAFSVMLAGGER